MLNPEILKTALLGLKANQIQKENFHPKVQEYLANIKNNEFLFLNGITLSFQYFEAGKELPVIEKLSTQVVACPEEHLPVVDNSILQVYDRMATNNSLSFNYYSFLRILSGHLLAQKKILPAQKLTQVVRTLLDASNYEKRRIKFETFYKIQSKRELSFSFEEVKNTIIDSFGQTGRWILQMMEGDKEQDVDEMDAKARKELFEQYWFFEREKVIPFLESFYLHETPANQKIFLKIISQSLTLEDVKIFAFFEHFFSANQGKRIEKLQHYFETVQLLIGTQGANNQLVESIFVSIWAPSNFLKNGLKLKPKAELTKILAPLDNFEMSLFVDDSGMSEIDLKLFFLFQLISSDRACQLLKVKPGKYISAISKIKTFQKNKQFDPLRALLRNILKSQDKESARMVMKLSEKTKHSYLELLLLFSDKEIYHFLESNFATIEYLDLDIFEVLVKELSCQEQWSKKLTRLMLNRILTHQHYYSYGNRRQQALWLGGPFYHESVNSIITRLIELDEHKTAWKKEELKIAIGNIYHVQSAFNNALKS